ncbi:hypothetical protein [Bradyrhizobium sp. AZCC 1699]|uniref:hypothetical protein n=1 Tax=Bradyrhizobium sp. AZCC 1699 TaxID=3117024 RepID=UPI002FF0ADC6
MSADERQLWCAVLVQAVDDATCALGKSWRRNLEIKSARDWLTKPSRDFTDVCRLAGYEPDRIRAQAIKRIDEVTPGDCPPPSKPKTPRRRRRVATNKCEQANANC